MSFIKKNTTNWNIHLYFGNQDRNVNLVQLTVNLETNQFEENGRVKYIGHTDHVRGLSFDNNSNNFASCSDDGTVRVWPADSKLMSRDIQSTNIFETHNHDVIAVDFKMNIVASGGKDRRLVVHDLNSKSKTKSKNTKNYKEILTSSIVTSLLLSDDGKEIYVGGGDGRLKIFKIGEKTLEMVVDEKIYDNKILTIKKINELIITASHDEISHITIWRHSR